jgi:hypothetical protein
MTLLIEVEEIAFGKVFRKLDEMSGVISINIRGSGVKGKGKGRGDNVVPFNPNRTKGGTPTCGMIVLKLLVDSGEPVTRDACMAELVKFGKAETNITSCMTDLVRRKLASRIGRAEYKATKKGGEYLAARSAA